MKKVRALVIGGPYDGRWEEIYPEQRDVVFHRTVPIPLGPWDRSPIASADIHRDLYRVNLWRVGDEPRLYTLHPASQDSPADVAKSFQALMEVYHRSRATAELLPTVLDTLTIADLLLPGHRQIREAIDAVRKIMEST